MDIKQGQTWLNKNGEIVHVSCVSKYVGRVFVADTEDERDADQVSRVYLVDGTGVDHVGESLVTRMPRIYIAGPMTGLPELNFPAFNAAAAELRKRGAWVENPVEICAAADITWEDAMRADIPRLMTCDSLHLLPGWQQSRGAAIEHDLAVALKMTITYPMV